MWEKKRRLARKKKKKKKKNKADSTKRRKENKKKEETAHTHWNVRVQGDWIHFSSSRRTTRSLCFDFVLNMYIEKTRRPVVRILHEEEEEENLHFHLFRSRWKCGRFLFRCLTSIRSKQIRSWRTYARIRWTKWRCTCSKIQKKTLSFRNKKANVQQRKKRQGESQRFTKPMWFVRSSMMMMKKKINEESKETIVSVWISFDGRKKGNEKIKNSFLPWRRRLIMLRNDATFGNLFTQFADPLFLFIFTGTHH